MKKVGKTTRPFRYDLNQIPYDYTVELRNRFKGLDLTDRVPDELWMEVCDIVQGSRSSSKKKNAKKQNDRILKEELPMSVGAKYATENQWRYNSRKK